MSTTSSPWSPSDTQRALAVWSDYLASHDVTALAGKTAGIEPDSGRIWFGDSAKEIAQQMARAGGQRPFYAVRVGGDHYVRKGGRR